MKVNVKILVLMFLCFSSYGKMQEYNYKQELKGVSEQWHNIVLPNNVFGKVTQNLADIRIFGILTNNDTIEFPYLLRLKKEKVFNKEVAFKMLNSSYNQKGYYFTFEVSATEPINQIKLKFKQQNFDWRLKLEGSQNQKEWFTVAEDYRILSIRNETINFQFTNLALPNLKYRYFRMLIDSKEKPDLEVASIAKYEITEGTYKNYAIKKRTSKINKQNKQTEIDIELKLPAAVSNIKIDVANTFDFYRPITIKYVADSLKTDKGWKYNYRTLTSGTLNSIGKNEFKFKSTTLQKLKIIVYNADNQSLSFDSIKIKGYVHELVARFTEPAATYFLTYGNSKAKTPNYDIDRFAHKIPTQLKTIKLGEEITIEKEAVAVTAPLFKNKNWLWLIMAVIIVLLGWFSVKMMRTV